MPFKHAECPEVLLFWLKIYEELMFHGLPVPKIWKFNFSQLAHNCIEEQRGFETEKLWSFSQIPPQNNIYTSIL